MMGTLGPRNVMEQVDTRIAYVAEGRKRAGNRPVLGRGFLATLR